MCSILDNKLFFSEQPGYRFRRHFLFWVVWYLYTIITHAANPYGDPEVSYFRFPAFTLSESFITVFAQVPLAYAMLYFVFPNFVSKKKYLQGLLWMIALWILGGILNLLLLGTVMMPLLSLVLSPANMPGSPPPNTSFFIAVINANKGAFSITASALMLKFAKHWYYHQHRSLQLQKENTEAQLQLLTAQVHPHFLFNTLNNIFSKTQTESPGGSKMIMSLSDMLRYILYEGQKQLVPLKQEVTMITEYIKLEQIRYGNKLDVHMLTPDKTDDIYIAPLLLLPFVENCFKHGASNILQNPWINLTIELKDTTLVMKLMNGKAAMQRNGNGKTGIGINNVRQRLELLYKNKYDLQTREDEEVFVVDLKVQLVRIKDLMRTEPTIHAESNSDYA
ncbi:MAG TPA: histidine kinase [Chitinophagaceae bacterium]